MACVPITTFFVVLVCTPQFLLQEGSCLVDYCTIQCCPQCSLIQELNELERASSYSTMPEILVMPVQQQQQVW